MSKQELIDKAVEELNGVLRNHKDYWFENGEMWLYFPEGSFDRLQLCTTEEFKQRARELGWCNGYKYGVDYETNGKKPDLPDDALVEVKCYSMWLDKGAVSEWGTWETITAFRIVDERYKPVEVERVQSDWYDYGKQQAIALPPVGGECEYKFANPAYDWTPVNVNYISENHAILLCLSDNHEVHTDGFTANKFRPLDWNRKADEERQKFVELASRIMHQSQCGVINDISLGELYEAGCRFTENKAAS